MEPFKPIRRVTIVGGTHGNELTGAYLIKKFDQLPHLVHRSSFETLTLLGNPKAFTAAKRYIDQDLNRCFLQSDLQDFALSSYEQQRAKELHRILTPTNEISQVIIDLHSTTANMGLTLILGNHHPFNLRLAAYLSSLDPSVRIYSCLRSNREHDTLRSLGELSFTLEVGAVPQGVLNAALFLKTETLIYAVLDYLERYNQQQLPSINRSITLYQYIEMLDYPRSDRGEIQAMIHPQLQDQDYQPLHPGSPIFLTLDDRVISYQGESIVHPIFINEAAYYEKGIAMCLTEKKQLKLEELGIRD